GRGGAAGGRVVALPGAWNVMGVADLTTGRLRPAPAGHAGPVTALAFSADGRRLLTWGSGRNCRVWDAGSGREAGAVELWQPAQVVLSPDGRSLAASAPDAVRVLDVTGKGRLRGQLRLDEGESCRVAFSADGKRLAALGLRDGSVKVYAAATLK